MKTRSLAEWATEIAEQEASGLSQQEWCKVRNININTYRDRKSILKQQRKKAPPKSKATETVGWITVNTATHPTPDSKAPKVKIGDFTILAETDFCEATFIRICKALKTLC